MQNHHKMSLYERLGLDKSASVEEIRRAYKDLAKQKHPDRGGDPEEFKQIQEAHEILTDEQRRRMYDLTGSTNEQGGPGGGMAAGGIPFEFMRGMGPFGMPGVAFDIGSMFGGMFGGGGPGPGPGGNRRPRHPKGPNKHHDIGLNLQDFYNGRDIKLKFNQARKCDGCKGSGAAEGGTEACGPCGGRGVRTHTQMIGPGMMAQQTGPCDACGGDGRRVLRPCKICHGKKYVEREKILDIQIRPGMREGQTLVFAGECSDSAEYDQPGDVVLTLRRADQPTADVDCWEWRGNDLWIRKRVSFAESVIGFKRTLEGHPSGKTLVVGWRKGALVHGATLQAPGWGMPTAEGHGTCFVQIWVDTPATREWNAEEREKLRELLGGEVQTMDSEDVVPLEPSSLDSRN